jgi:hypothetical protein
MRMKQLRSRTVAVLKLFLMFPLLLALLATTALAGTVPKAPCGPNDRVETGLQGQTTLAERLSGDSELGYNCNLELVGQFQGEGAKWQMAWFDDCAYYGTNNNPMQQRRGTVVVDASDPRNPQAIAILDSRAMLDPHESLKVNRKRSLLGATKGPGFGPTLPTDRQFAFYDVSGDCTHPKLLSDVDVPGHVGHAGDFAPDGMTYWGTGGGGITAMDISDPSNPRQIGRWLNRTHDISISEDGTRAYLAQQGNFPAFGVPGPNGLVILDVSDIQLRRPNPQPRVISTLFWDDGGVAQQTTPVIINGRPHLIFTDETGPSRLPTAAAGRADSCARGLPPFGFARIIDISDERNPQIVAKLMLEVHDPANCALVLDDFVPAIADLDFYGYTTHYCGVDKRENPKLLACGYLGAGLRVFDIRDPVHPKEIAYYKPPARRTAFLPGSAIWADYGGRDRTTDRVQTQIRFRKHEGELHIWFTSQDNGFQIVRFTNELLARTGLDKFEQDHPGNGN